jgi:hypothetical protein
MKSRRCKFEYSVAGRKPIHRGPTAAMWIVCAAVIWGWCLLGSSPAATGSDAAGMGAVGFGSFGTDAFAFAPLAELAPVASDPSKESDSENGEHSAGDSAATTQKDPEYHPVPEPQTWVIAFSGLATLVALQRLRRRPGMRRL